VRLSRFWAIVLSHWVATYAMLAGIHFAIEPLKTYRYWFEAVIEWTLEPLVSWYIPLVSLTGILSEPRLPAVVWGSYLPAFVITYWLVGPRRYRLPPPGKCQKCGYDLRGTPERCPECGAANEEALETLLLK
jgi:hypothetical protein